MRERKGLRQDHRPRRHVYRTLSVLNIFSRHGLDERTYHIYPSRTSRNNRDSVVLVQVETSTDAGCEDIRSEIQRTSRRGTGFELLSSQYCWLRSLRRVIAP